MNKGRISASQLRHIVVLISLLPFICFFGGASGWIEAVAMAALEWALLVAVGRIKPCKCCLALRVVGAVYFEIGLIAAVICFGSIVVGTVDTELLPLLAAAALAIAVRAAVFGCEAAARFSSIAAAVSAPILPVMFILMAGFAELRYLLPPAAVFFSFRPIFWAAMPMPAVIFLTFRQNLAEGEKAPCLSAANTVFALKTAAALLLQACLGPLLGQEKTPFLYLGEIAGGTGSALVVCLLSLSFIGISISAMATLLLASAFAFENNRKGTVFLLAIPALAFAITGGLA